MNQQTKGDQSKPPVIALVGSPNSGKTTIFNQLTASNYKTGNWAGVTVEKVEGSFFLDKEKISPVTMIDLPGCTSILSSDGNSPDELVVKHYLETKQADLAVSILDSTNLEQGLYQCIQLSIMKIPYMVVCNMSDIAHVRGITIRVDDLSKILNVPVISTSAVNKNSLLLLKEAISQALFAVSRDKLKPNPIDLQDLESVIFNDDDHLNDLNLKEIISINDFIYKLSSEYVSKTVVKQNSDTTILQDKIDRIVLHKYLGLPIFFFIMYLMFFFALTIGNGILVPGLGQLANIPFVDIPTWILQEIHAPGIIITIIANGLGTAIATLVGFIPVVGLVYLFMSVLEASGYMVRASIVIDRSLNLVGLSGSMFLPLVVGFGCNIATIAGSRTLPSYAEKQATILMSPFMSCSARLPVYALFCAAFLPQYSAIVVFSMYIIGIALAIFTGIVVKNTFLKSKKSPLIIRMPNYLRPQWRMILKITGNNIKMFLYRLKGMFLILVTVVGVLGAVNSKGDINIHMKDSILADISKKVTVLLYPIGFTEKDWQATVGLISGAVAKETVVGTMTSIYAQSDSNDDNIVTNNEISLKTFSMYLGGLIILVILLMLAKKRFVKHSQWPFMIRLRNYLRPEKGKIIRKVAGDNMKSFTRRFTLFLIIFIVLSGIVITNMNTSAHIPSTSGQMNLLSVIKQEIIDAKDIFIDGIKSSFNYDIGSTVDNDDIKVIKNNAIRFNDPYLTYGFLLFTLSYFPCFATLAMAKKEGGMKIALFSGVWSLTLAYLTAGTFFCLTHLDTISTTRLITELVILWGVLIIEIFIMKFMANKQNHKINKVVFN